MKAKIRITLLIASILLFAATDTHGHKELLQEQFIGTENPLQELLLKRKEVVQ